MVFHSRISRINNTNNIRVVMIQKCPKCGEEENFHFNLDWSKNPPVVESILCNECGEFIFLTTKSTTTIEDKKYTELKNIVTKENENLGMEIYVEDPILGGFTSFFKDFPDIVAEGETKEEARKNLWAAAHDVLKYLIKK